jgi:molybdenum cofactor biosynthesis enzyme
MGGKKTADLIPFCHPIALEDCQIDIKGGKKDYKF